MDLKNTAGDMDLTNGDLSFVTGQDAIAQDINMKLGTWLGESVYDTTEGLPYLQVIFQGKNPNLNEIKAIVDAAVETVDGVISSDCTPALDRLTRVLTITGTAETIEGDVDFSKTVEASP